MNKIEIVKRLYNSYTKKYLKNIFIAFFFSILLAGSTSAVAYLLDPAIKKLFIEQNQSMIIIIPCAIVLAFAIKGASLYLARVLMIGVSEEVKKDIQNDIFSSLLKADTKVIDEKHSGNPINATSDKTNFRRNKRKLIFSKKTKQLREENKKEKQLAQKKKRKNKKT